MDDLPQTRYAQSGDLHIAYQVMGDGPVDLVFIHGWGTHVEAQWEGALWARFLRRLAAFSRLIMFDTRGTGLSDPLPSDHRPTLEGWMQDMAAVMDAVGADQVALLGASDGGPMAMLFAATYPERTSALALVNSFAGLTKTSDRPWGTSQEAIDAAVARAGDQWADPAILDLFAPTVAGDNNFRERWTWYQRLCASPGVARGIVRTMAEVDVSAVLPTIRVPTLVVHREDDPYASVENGRQIAARIAGARYVELPGVDHFYFVGDAEAILDEVEEFLTGVRHGLGGDRVLATVLFSDIVDSTAQTETMGDRAWRDRLDAHDAMVRRQLERFRGREIKTIGDGFLATFDGPARAIQCGCAIRDGARHLAIEVRVGLHTGEVELRGDDIVGATVNLGARVAARAGAGEVWVSRTVTDLVAGSGIKFEDRGQHELKGVAGSWQLFSVES